MEKVAVFNQTQPVFKSDNAEGPYLSHKKDLVFSASPHRSQATQCTLQHAPQTRWVLFLVPLPAPLCSWYPHQAELGLSLQSVSDASTTMMLRTEDPPTKLNQRYSPKHTHTYPRSSIKGSGLKGRKGLLETLT